MQFNGKCGFIYRISFFTSTALCASLHLTKKKSQKYLLTTYVPVTVLDAWEYSNEQAFKNLCPYRSFDYSFIW